MKKLVLSAIMVVGLLSCEPQATDFCGNLGNIPTVATIPNHPEIHNYYFVTIGGIDYYVPDGPGIRDVIKNNKVGDRVCLETSGIKKINTFNETSN